MTYIKKNRIKSGFTLVELMVVISIITLLSSVVLAALQGAKVKGVLSSAQTFDDHIYHAFGANAVVAYTLDNLPNSASSDLSGNINPALSCPSGGLSPTLNTVDFIKGNGSLLFGNTPVYNCSNTSFPFLSTINKFSQTNGSISFWVKPLAIPGSTLIIASVDGLAIGLTSSMQINLLNGPFSLTSATPLVNNTWQHVLISWGSATTLIYINGKIDTNSAGTVPAFNASPSTLTLGNNGASFYGLLDQFAVYSQSIQSP